MATRAEIIQQVLDRMDEICPAEDINISEGELIDRLMDDALLQFLRMANVDTLYNNKIDVSVTQQENSVFGCFSVPADFIRFVSCQSSGWKRSLHESDLLTTDSAEWKMAHMLFREPSPLKPMIALLPKEFVQVAPKDETDNTVYSSQNVFEIAPYAEEDTVKVSYVAEIKPENFYNGKDNVMADTHSESLWYAYIWYLTSLTLQTMGQADLSTLALQHMQSYQVIPDGMPSTAPAA